MSEKKKMIKTELETVYLTTDDKKFLTINDAMVHQGILEKHKENKMDIPDYLNDLIGIGSVNLRKYDKNIGGYHSMHCDWGQNNLQRFCAVILYLNTVEEGGETIFPVIGRKIKPVVGRILIFPSFYTHMHYGEIATSGDRYIVASHVHYSNRDIIKK